MLDDAGKTVFEATSIIEHLAAYHLPSAGLIPFAPDDALAARQMDRVFDN